MNYVNVIRRIDLLNKAFDRTPDDDRHETIMEAIWDKRKTLVGSLKAYLDEDAPVGSEKRKAKRQQLKTACRLLNVEYHSVMV